MRPTISPSGTEYSLRPVPLADKQPVAQYRVSLATIRLTAACLAIVCCTTIAAAEEAKTITAGQIVDRIRANVGCEWSQRTVDTFKAGDPDTPVTGVAVTFAATLDVLKRAQAAGCNFIITHEPTFYQGSDNTSQIEGDQVLAAKRAFIEKHDLVIWRFHDHWHRRVPDGIVEGMVEALGWQRHRDKDNPRLFTFPPTTLKQFAAQLKKRMEANSVRVVGDPEMQFSRVGLCVGAPPAIAQIELLQRDDVEVLVGGESREWETVEYVRDAAELGKKKALILLGHVISEEAGMRYMGQWLSGFVDEVPVEYVPAGEPFWSP